MLELMARGGMRIGEVLKLKPEDIEERKLFITDPYYLHWSSDDCKESRQSCWYPSETS